jgi:type II secretory pathway pseudopilin PulG
MFTIFKKRHEKGFVLTEHLGGLLIYIMMVGAAVGILFTVNATSKLATAEQSIMALAINVQGLYSSANNYTGLTNDIALRAGLVPAKFTSNNTIKTPWGGAITLSPGSDITTFQIKMDGIGQGDCVKLGVYQLEYWVDLAVNGSSINTSTSVSDAVSACGASNNTVTYIVR